MTRTCLREPIPEIFRAAATLDDALAAHLCGNAEKAAALIELADDPLIREFTESVWGKRTSNIHQFVEVSNPLPRLAIEERPRPRMPDGPTMESVTWRDGFHCRFCGMPVIPADARRKFRQFYPRSVRWGPRNADQHAAFQCMWLQFDHLVPNQRGGTSDEQNIVVTCAPCNFGRMDFTLEEAQLQNPLNRKRCPSWDRYQTWDGLRRILANPMRTEKAVAVVPIP